MKENEGAERRGKEGKMRGVEGGGGSENRWGQWGWEKIREKRGERRISDNVKEGKSRCRGTK